MKGWENPFDSNYKPLSLKFILPTQSQDTHIFK